MIVPDTVVSERAMHTKAYDERERQGFDVKGCLQYLTSGLHWRLVGPSKPSRRCCCGIDSNYSDRSTT